MKLRGVLPSPAVLRNEIFDGCIRLSVVPLVSWMDALLAPDAGALISRSGLKASDRVYSPPFAGMTAGGCRRNQVPPRISRASYAPECYGSIHQAV